VGSVTTNTTATVLVLPVTMDVPGDVYNVQPNPARRRG